MARTRNNPSISVRSSSPSGPSSSSPSNVVFCRAAIPSHLLCTASLLLTIYISRPENFQLANAAIRYLPLFQIMGFVALERLGTVLESRSGGRVRGVEWFGLGDGGPDPTWLGKANWREGLIGGGLIAVELITLVETLSGMNNKAALSLIALSSPLLLINPRAPFSSPHLMLGLLLLFIANFSLLLSISSTETGIARHQQFISQISALLCAGARVGGEWWVGTGVRKGRIGGGRKGGLIALVLVFLVTIIRTSTSSLPSTGFTFSAFPLLVFASIIFGLSILVPLSTPYDTPQRTLVLPALTTFFHFSLVFTVLATVTFNPINANHALLFLLGSIGEYLINSQHSSSVPGYDPISIAESYDLPPISPRIPNGASNGNGGKLGDLDDEPRERSDQNHLGNGIKLAMMALSIAPAVIWLAGDLQGPLGTLGVVIDEVGIVRGENWIREVDFDIVISYFDEDLKILRSTIDTIKETLPEKSTTKTIVYAKDPKQETKEGLEKLQEDSGADEVVSLVNVGREGETYLQHITRHHSSVKYPLATQTFFLQPHLAWEDVVRPRLDTVHASTGFISFGPYLNASCKADGSEVDSHGQAFPRIGQIYATFRGDFCPPQFLITWAGQFLVSKKRIEQNPLSMYQNLLDYFDVPKGQGSSKGWIWEEGYWDNDPSKPTLGYALERSWPLIFDCADPSPVWQCKGDKGPECECRDD